MAEIVQAAVTTDLYPTFLEAAGLEPPSNVRLDGMSFLSELLPSEKLAGAGQPSPITTLMPEYHHRYQCQHWYHLIQTLWHEDG